VTTDQKIAQLSEFRKKLLEWSATHDLKLREWLSQNVQNVRREVVEAGCFQRFTIAPPPAVGGLVVQDADLFGMIYQSIYGLNPVPHICDMIDMTIGELRNPPPKPLRETEIISEIQQGYAFVAMPMDRNNHQLVDVLEAIKAGAKECGVTAERVDDDDRNERITDRMLESIQKAQFVIVDLTNERPNVFYEAGYAHGKERFRFTLLVMAQSCIST
jgi:hypothetical protein